MCTLHTNPLTTYSEGVFLALAKVAYDSNVLESAARLMKTLNATHNAKKDIQPLNRMSFFTNASLVQYVYISKTEPNTSLSLLVALNTSRLQCANAD